MAVPARGEESKQVAAVNSLQEQTEQAVEQLRLVLERNCPCVDFVLSVQPSSGIVVLNYLFVGKQKRSQGAGSDFMRRLCAWADTQNTTLALEPDSAHGGSKTRLVQFYKRFGFHPHRNSRVRESLLRYPAARANPAPSKTRQLWWHGTSPAHLRSVLKHGLAPTGQGGLAKPVYDSDDRNGFRSIRTFGGVYLTQRLSKAEGYAYGADRRLRPQDGSRALLVVGLSLDARTPGVWADEDSLIIPLEMATGIRNYDDFYKLPDPGHKLYDLKGWNSKVYFDAGKLPEAVVILESLDFSTQAAGFLEQLQYDRPPVAKQIAAKRPRVETACQDLIRAFVLHLLEMACLNAPSRYKQEEEHATLYSYSPERFERLQCERARVLALLAGRPAQLHGTWQRLVRATDALCQLLPALALPHSEFSTVRMMEPVGYTGRNRIALVLERPCSSDEGKVAGGRFGTLYRKTVTVHYCANPAFLEEYKRLCEQEEIFPVFVRPERELRVAANPADSTDMAESYARALDAALPHVLFNLDPDGAVRFTCPKGVPCVLYPDPHGGARIWTPEQSLHAATPERAVAFARTLLAQPKRR